MGIKTLKQMNETEFLASYIAFCKDTLSMFKAGGYYLCISAYRVARTNKWAQIDPEQTFPGTFRGVMNEITKNDSINFVEGLIQIEFYQEDEIIDRDEARIMWLLSYIREQETTLLAFKLADKIKSDKIKAIKATKVGANHGN